MTSCKNITCCFSGHREIAIKNEKEITNTLEKTIIEYIKSGYSIFETGGAKGFDTLAAKTVLKLKAKYPYIKLKLVLPCKSQTRKWNFADVKEYEFIKYQADSVIYTSESYTRGCIFKRNRQLVDDSSACICYLNKKTGGTYYTVKYAISNHLKIVNVFRRV